MLLLEGPHCLAAEKSAITLYFGAVPAILHNVGVQEQSQQTSAKTQTELSSCAFLFCVLLVFFLMRNSVLKFCFEEQ